MTAEKSIPAPEDEILLAIVRDTAWSRDGLLRLSKQLPTDRDIIFATLRLAVTRMEGAAGTMLAMAAATRGYFIDVTEIIPMVPVVTDLRWIPLLIGLSEGDRIGELLALTETGRLTRERQALTLLIVVELLEGASPPPRLLAQIRTMARTQVRPAAGIPLGLAAAGVDDEACRKLAETWITIASGTNGPGMRTWVRRDLAGPPAAVFPEIVPRQDKDAPKRLHARVGRNDPCPCKSGRKFKRCCDGKAASDPAPVWPTAAQLDADGLDGPVEQQSIDTIVRLDFPALETPDLVDALQELITFHFWEPAERAMEVLASRTNFDEDETPDNYRDELIDGAISAGALDVAHRQIAKAKDPETTRRTHHLALALVEPSHQTAPVLEEHARRALSDDEVLIDLTFTMLRHLPAIGILIARGAVTPSRDLDSLTVLTKVEEARDRLQLPPGDRAADVYELLLEQQMDDRVAPEATTTEDRQELLAEMVELRDDLKKATIEVTTMQKRLAEQEEELRARPIAPVLSAPNLDGDQVRKRFEAKIAELKGRIAEGQEERALLREELVCASARLQLKRNIAQEKPADKAPHPAETDASPPERYKALIPVFTDAVRDAVLGTADPGLSRHAVKVAGTLAAGDPAAWSSVKRLRARSELFSVRIGLYHRLLFRLDRGRSVLDVLAFIHRRDLDVTIRHLE